MATFPVPPFVDGIAVVLHLLRTELPPLRPDLPEVNVYEDIPDRLSEHLPAVVVRRTRGDSPAPRFFSDFWMHVQVWDATFEQAFDLSQLVAQVIYAAWEDQTLTPYGHISKWRESQGFRKFPDPDLPHIGRYDAVYDLRIRNIRAS
jgi:hypothetical protein